jgi:uncharacterized membrane protein
MRQDGFLMGAIRLNSGNAGGVGLNFFFGMAIADHNFRPTFGDLAKVGVGGYRASNAPRGK